MNRIEDEYQKLLKEVQTNKFYETDLTNRVNCYVCKSCGHITKTKDVDAGVTPFMFSCEKCNQTAISSFYQDIAPNQSPTIEWYRPTLKQTLNLKNRPGELEHVLNGGLLNRKIIKE